MRELKCKNCGAGSFSRINKDTIECRYCGIQLRNKKFHESEEQKNDFELDSDELCDNTDKHISEQKETKEKESSDKKSFILVKLMLCLFLGYVGVHKFVEGRIFMGIVYIFTYGLFGFGILCDIIRYAKELSTNSGEEQE